MRAAILQPSYIPWRGYFAQIHTVDTFVFYDDVAFGSGEWRNRNRVKGPTGSFWLTIPVFRKGVQLSGLAINRIRIDWSRRWARKHLATLKHLYGAAPYFDRYVDLLTAFYTRHDEFLADFTIDFTIALARELGLRDKHFLRAAELSVDGPKTDRLLRILKRLDARTYVTGPSARLYLDERRLKDEGIGVEYMTYDYPEYEQRFPPFDPYVSILDLLFMKGPEAPSYIWRSDQCR